MNKRFDRNRAQAQEQLEPPGANAPVGAISTGYAFKVDTTRERLLEAIDTVEIIETQSQRTGAQISLALERMASHALEIEAVCTTLRLQGFDKERLLDGLKTMTPEHVFVELQQDFPGADVVVRQFRG